MALVQVAANADSDIDQLNQIIQHLQGASGKTDAYLFRSSTGNNYIIVLSDSAGARKFSIKDFAENEVFSVDSDGNVVAAGTITTSGASIFPLASAPAQTAEGSVVWDTDDDVLTVGTGAATKRIGLLRGAGSAASATSELMYDTTAATLQAWDGSASRTVGRPNVTKYKAAAQTVSASTTFVTITAASGNFDWAIGASEVWRARLVLPMAYTGTGGFKFQFTGPSAPTAVRIDAQLYELLRLDATTPKTSNIYRPFTASAFSSAMFTLNAGGSEGDTGTGGTIDASTTAPVYIDALIINGANAGTVTAQFAQNSGNGTTVIGIGATMDAWRVA